MNTTLKPISFFQKLAICALLLCHLTLIPSTNILYAADEPGVVDRTKETVKDATAAVKEAAHDAKESVQEAGRAVGNGFENLWRRVDETRLTYRNRDEVAAWVIMGILAGAVAGAMTSLKTTGLGRLGRILLGLAGAFIGGIIVHVSRIDFGMGPVLIRYEELLFSFVGAVLLILIFRLVRSGANKKPTQD